MFTSFDIQRLETTLGRGSAAGGREGILASCAGRRALPAPLARMMERELTEKAGKRASFVWDLHQTLRLRYLAFKHHGSLFSAPVCRFSTFSPHPFSFRRCHLTQTRVPFSCNDHPGVTDDPGLVQLRLRPSRCSNSYRSDDGGDVWSKQQVNSTIKVWTPCGSAVAART